MYDNPHIRLHAPFAKLLLAAHLLRLQDTMIMMMPGSKGQKAVHACMIRLLNLGPAKHEEGVICVANQRIPNVCRIAGAACCGAIRNEIFRWHQLWSKGLLPPTDTPAILHHAHECKSEPYYKI